MKKLLSLFILASITLLASVTVFAVQNNSLKTDTTTAVTPATTSTNTQQLNSMWTCTTNASSATSGSVEEKADKDMANNAKLGDNAFKFALQHCRDCTKISCYISNQTTTPTTTSSTTKTSTAY